jgi:hypothetical protein
MLAAMEKPAKTAAEKAELREKLESLAPAEKTDANARIYAYLKDNGAFKLLKPALLAVDRHRPDDAPKYIATFMTTAVESITAE